MNNSEIILQSPISPLAEKVDDVLHNIAKANVDIMLNGEEVPLTTRYAMEVVEELKRINGLDLLAVLKRGQLIQEIIDKNLLAVHPARYSTLEELARDQGISVTELSQTRDLCEIVFPFLNNMGINIYMLWDKIGKSKMKEMLPVLKVLITGERSATTSVNIAIENLRDEFPESSNEEIIANLLEEGELLTNTMLRDRLRPTRTPQITFYEYLCEEGEKLYIMAVTPEQDEMIRRKMGNYGGFYTMGRSVNKATEKINEIAARLRELV